MSANTVGVWEVFFGQTNKAVTVKLVKYSALMFGLPIFTFYFLFYAIFKGDPEKLGVCGIGAVIAVNFVIFLYVKMAYSGDDNPPPEDEVIMTGGGKGMGSKNPKDKNRTD